MLFYNNKEDKRFSVVASKKVGNAVKRNFSKRRLKALFINHSNLINDGVYILVAKPDILTASFDEISKQFQKSLQAVKALS